MLAEAEVVNLRIVSAVPRKEELLCAEEMH